MSQFRKAKLSHSAVDAFMLKYIDKQNLQNVMQYTTKDKKCISVSLSNALLGTDEYLYLFGQISAIHKKLESFPINQTAVIQKPGGKEALWTRDTDLLKSFVQMGNSLGVLHVSKRIKGINCLSI